MPRAPIALLVAVVATLGVVACERDGDGPTFANTPTTTSAPPIRSEAEPGATSPTPPATPAEPPPTSAAPSAGCVDGWVTPAEGTPERTDPIGVIRRTARFRGDYVIVDMRMFTGPESPPSDKGYIAEVRRWYVKLYAADDLRYQARFLVEERRFGRGVAAVAPYDTEGFASPDWIGFQHEAGSEPTRYPGLPGRWAGVPYDFVEGGEGLTIPGLPEEVRGCLQGT